MSGFRGLAMRAILVRQFGGAEKLKAEDSVPVPAVGEKQVLIKVYSSGVNPVDTYIREGAFSSPPQLPYTPGIDGAGVVEAIGSLVVKIKVGDRVLCSQTVRSGTLAEYVAMDEDHVFPLGGGLNFHEGAAIGIPYFTAYHALFQCAHAQKGDRVLIHGASGAVGLASVQVAKFYGMTVVGTAGTEEGLKLVKSIGADEVYNHREKDYVAEMVKEDGPKFDVILEMLANVNLQKDITLMNRRGTTVVVGCRGNIKISPRDMMFPETSIIGCALLASTEDEWKELTTAITQGVKDGWVKPVIDKVYDLGKACDAHHDIIHSSGAKGKLVVKIRDE